MKKIVFTLIFSLLCLGIAISAPVDVNRAKTLGVKFMNSNTSIRTADAKLVYTAYTNHQKPCFYVFSVTPRGFVIVSADDRAKPILGYSTESSFSSETITDGLMTYFENYRAGFDYLIENNLEQPEQAATAWKRLAETGKLNDERITRSVGPLMSSTWNQTDLYNNMAPLDSTSVFSGHCKSGCVANAMSQVMRYWEWPRVGNGSHSYYCYGYGATSYGTLAANFGESTYHFELMPDFLDFASPQSEVDATALLEYHAGVSVDMSYGPSASGAYSESVPTAFSTYFRYDPEMDMRYLYNSSQSQWEEDLRANLDGGMPLYYGSSGDAGGHAYILDGYDDNNMFHLNWGWQGFDNGYYAIDGFYLTFYSFPYYHTAIFNLRPDATYLYCPKPVTGLEASRGDDMNVNITFSPTYMTNGDWEIQSIDSIVVMRDGVNVAYLTNVTDQQVNITDVVDKNATYYYTVYALKDGNMSKVARDTVMVGHTCEVRFDRHDSGGNGWDMSFIAVLDEDGKVSRRVGLSDGASASTVELIPRGQNATFFWSYDNSCYSHNAIVECSYEIFDWDNNLIAASEGTPTVGDIAHYDINCEVADVQEETTQQNPLVYPNPASDKIYVDGDVTRLVAFNAIGQQVFAGSQSVIDIASWSEGLYLFKVELSDGTVSIVKVLKH